jgi:general stress protein YciG
MMQIEKTQIEQPNDHTPDEIKTDTPEITPAKPKSNRGFASMDPERQREIASKGGHASGGNFANNRERAAEAGRKGGQLSGGNFANNRQRAVEAGRKGGQHSSGNFANNRERAANAGRKGGQASSGQRQQGFSPQQPTEIANTKSDLLRRQ